MLVVRKSLSACAGINAGLVHLAKLQRLWKVSMDATARVTRAGIAVWPAGVRVDFWTGWGERGPLTAWSDSMRPLNSLPGG